MYKFYYPFNLNIVLFRYNINSLPTKKKSLRNFRITLVSNGIKTTGKRKMLIYNAREIVTSLKFKSLHFIEIEICDRGRRDYYGTKLVDSWSLTNLVRIRVQNKRSLISAFLIYSSFLTFPLLSVFVYRLENYFNMLFDNQNSFFQKLNLLRKHLSKKKF